MSMWNKTLFLSVVASLGVISATLCAPALPFIADRFATQFFYVQFIISLFLIGNALGQILSGPLADQLGQRTILLSGLFIYILGSCGCALADQMSILLGARFFQGMGSAVGPVLARAITSSSFSPNRSAQVQSYGTMGVGIASILAIFLSGELTLFSWRANFWFAAAFGVFLLLWAHTALKNPISMPKTISPQPLSLKPIFTQAGQILQHKQFLGSALCHSLAYGLMYGYITLFPFALIEILHDKNPSHVGIYSAYMIAFYMLGASLAAYLVPRPRWKAPYLIMIGIALQLVSGILLTISPSTAFFFPILFLFNLSLGMILPLTAAHALAPFSGSSIRNAVGTASSSLGLFYRLIGSLVSTLICLFPLAEGKNLGMAIVVVSSMNLILFGRLSFKNLAVGDELNNSHSVQNTN